MSNDEAIISGGARRPLKVRQKQWAIVSAAWLANRGIEPRWISISSFVFAILSSEAFVAELFVQSWIIRSLLLIFAAAIMQLRLVGNLLDGMVAVEGNRRTPDGELYNDLPDRFSDWALLGGGNVVFVQLGEAGSLHLFAKALHTRDEHRNHLCRRNSQAAASAFSY